MQIQSTLTIPLSRKVFSAISIKRYTGISHPQIEDGDIYYEFYTPTSRGRKSILVVADTGKVIWEQPKDVLIHGTGKCPIVSICEVAFNNSLEDTAEKACLLP